MAAMLAWSGHAATLSAAEPAASVAVTSPTVGAVDYLRTIDTNQLEQFAKPRSFWGKMLEWVAGPAERPWLGRPYALTEANLGRLIVTDPGQGVVHILDFERREYAQISKAKRQRLLSPVGVAVDGDDNIYVTDSELAAVFVFSRKGEFLRALGTSSKGRERLFQRPTGLALDPERRLLFVTDTWSHQVLVLDVEGNVLTTIGKRGAGPGEFNYPTSLALVGGELYVVDAMNFRIQVLTSGGEFVRSFGELGNSTGTLNRPKGIGVDEDGNVYVVDALFETVQVFDSRGELLYYFGSGGRDEGEFTLPSGIYINPGNHIYIADSHNQRIQVFRYRPLGR
jgi:DNA-binding beta-propeller fold protein YncE